MPARGRVRVRLTSRERVAVLEWHGPWLGLELGLGSGLGLGLTLTRLGFFLFSLQVHEKHVLLPLLPAVLLMPSAPRELGWFVTLCTFSLFPLLRRDGQARPHVLLSPTTADHRLTCPNPNPNPNLTQTLNPIT